MAEKDKRPLAMYGLKNVKYAKRTADGEPGEAAIPLPKGKSLQLNTAINMTEVYANDERILMIPADQGYNGTYGCTGQDLEFEEKIGFLIKLDDGTYADIKINDMERIELYFERTFKPAEGSAFVMKAWIYGAELGKPSKNSQTNTQNITIGDYQYPINVYGETILEEADKPYCDDNGNELVALMIISVPGDDGYKTFGEKPPKPVKTKPAENP